MIWAADAMNSMPIHVAGDSPVGVIPEIRSTESSGKSSSSFSQHLQQSVAAHPEAVSRHEDVHPHAAAAKSMLSGGKTMASNTPHRSTEHAGPVSAPGPAHDNRFKKTETGSARTTERTGEWALKTDGLEESGPEAASQSDPKALSDAQSEAPAEGQSSTAQVPAGSAGKTPPLKTARGTADKPWQSFLALNILTGTQAASPASTSCDFTQAVTQPIAPADPNSAQVSAGPVKCAVDSGPSGEAACPRTGSRDVADPSHSADNGMVAGKNNSVVTMKSDLADSAPGQANAFDSAVALESLPIDSMPAADMKDESDPPRAGDDSAAMKASASHHSSPVATLDVRGLASPMPEGFTASLNPVQPADSVPGNQYVEGASPARTSDRDTQAVSSPHPSAPSASNSPAPSTGSAPSDQAPPPPLPRSTWEGVPSMSFNAPLAGDRVSTAGGQTGGQSGAGSSSDHPLPGAPILNVASFGSHSSTIAVPFQLESGGGVMPDSPAKSLAQAQETPQPMQDGVVEAWQNVSAHMDRVNGAALNSLANGTEMRVQLHTDAFGPLEIRATLEAGRIGAAIGVQNPEAHHTLLGQVSELQQSLADKHVQLDNVTVVRTSDHSSTDLGWSSNQQRDDSAPYSRLAQQFREQASSAEPAFVPEAEIGQTENLWGRLSVRA